MDENKELVETMEDYAEELEASFKRLHEGDIVTGTVVAVTDDQVLVDLKYFAQGVIDRENLSNDPDFKYEGRDSAGRPAHGNGNSDRRRRGQCRFIPQGGE